MIEHFATIRVVLRYAGGAKGKACALSLADRFARSRCPFTQNNRLPLSNLSSAETTPEPTNNQGHQRRRQAEDRGGLSLRLALGIQMGDVYHGIRRE